VTVVSIWCRLHVAMVRRKPAPMTDVVCSPEPIFQSQRGGDAAVARPRTAVLAQVVHDLIQALTGTRHHLIPAIT
jgi:hypothetical protein